MNRTLWKNIYTCENGRPSQVVYIPSPISTLKSQTTGPQIWYVLPSPLRSPATPWFPWYRAANLMHHPSSKATTCPRINSIANRQSILRCNNVFLCLGMHSNTFGYLAGTLQNAFHLEIISFMQIYLCIFALCTHGCAVCKTWEQFMLESPSTVHILYNFAVICIRLLTRATKHIYIYTCDIMTHGQYILPHSQSMFSFPFPALDLLGGRSSPHFSLLSSTCTNILS